MFKIISENKVANEIRELIKNAGNNVKNGLDHYEQFEYVYEYMNFARKCGTLSRKTLDKLWKELQMATKKIVHDQ